MSTNARHPGERTLGLRLPGRYAVRGHIATGGMASVFCAEDRLLGRTVAIKVLSERFASDELAIRRFKREARAAARVSAHPHVVTIFDVGDTEDDSPSAFIVMEYLAGGTVAEALRGDSVTRSDARRWLREAGPALDHAHERGVVHRDIKPANFLLDSDRSLHVADFGIARLQSEDTITGVGELFGTAAYVAPEQALGREATSASDRYSLAVAAFELLTRGRPFTAPHFAAQARQHIEERPPRASHRDPTLPATVDQVLWRGMAKDPEARYPTAVAFVEALEGALDGEQTGATGLVAPAARAASGGGSNVPRAPTASKASAASNPIRPAGGGGGRPRTGRVAALGALAIVALGVALLIWLLPAGSSSNSTNAGHASNNAAVTPPASSHKHHRTHAHKQTVTHSQSATSAAPPPAASTTATAAPSTAPPSSSTAPPPTTPAALQLQGHDQMLAGTYPEAIATLHRALQAAAPGSLTYAYALYDLGRSLLLSGDPNDAIGVLEQRLRIPNQTGVVRETLDQALRAAGQAPQPAGPSGAAPPGTGNGPGNGHGGGPGPSAGRGGGPGKSNGNGNGNDDGGDSGNVSGGVSAG